MMRVAPLVPAGLDLRSHDHMPLHVGKLLGSDFVLGSSAEEFMAAVMLWCNAWHQVPASSLPNDERLLAGYAGCGRDLAAWERVRAGAMRGFVLCTDNRWYHRDIAEAALTFKVRRTAYIERARAAAKARWKGHEVTGKRRMLKASRKHGHKHEPSNATSIEQASHDARAMLESMPKAIIDTCLSDATSNAPSIPQASTQNRQIPNTRLSTYSSQPSYSESKKEREETPVSSLSLSENQSTLSSPLKIYSKSHIPFLPSLESSEEVSKTPSDAQASNKHGAVQDEFDAMEIAFRESIPKDVFWPILASVTTAPMPLLANDYDLTTKVLPTLISFFRQWKQRGFAPKSWAYVEKAVRSRLEENASREPQKTPPKSQKTSDTNWPVCIELWKQIKIWYAPGPPPDEPNCLAPQELLAQFGLAKKPNNGGHNLTSEPRENEEPDWDALTAKYRETDFWDRDQFGPPPEESGCHVPDEIQRRYEYEPVKIDAFGVPLPAKHAANGAERGVAPPLPEAVKSAIEADRKR